MHISENKQRRATYITGIIWLTDNNDKLGLDRNTTKSSNRVTIHLFIK